jgi:hypothetical protein
MSDGDRDLTDGVVDWFSVLPMHEIGKLSQPGDEHATPGAQPLTAAGEADLPPPVRRRSGP